MGENVCVYSFKILLTMYMCAHFLKIIRDYYSNIRKFALHVHFKTSVNVPSN